MSAVFCGQSGAVSAMTACRRLLMARCPKSSRTMRYSVSPSAGTAKISTIQVIFCVGLPEVLIR